MQVDGLAPVFLQSYRSSFPDLSYYTPDPEWDWVLSWWWVQHCQSGTVGNLVSDQNIELLPKPRIRHRRHTRSEPWTPEEDSPAISEAPQPLVVSQTIPYGEQEMPRKAPLQLQFIPPLKGWRPCSLVPNGHQLHHQHFVWQSARLDASAYHEDTANLWRVIWHFSQHISPLFYRYSNTVPNIRGGTHRNIHCEENARRWYPGGVLHDQQLLSNIELVRSGFLSPTPAEPPSRIVPLKCDGMNWDWRQWTLELWLIFFSTLDLLPVYWEVLFRQKWQWEDRFWNSG